MLRACACVVSVLLTSGCSSGTRPGEVSAAQPETIVISGRTMEVARLTEAVSGLCQARREAATDPAMAKTTYDRRSRDTIDAIAQVLEPSYSVLAGSLRATMQRLQSDSATEPAQSSLLDDLGRLAAFTREGLAQVGITTEACAA